MTELQRTQFRVKDYDLGETLNSGQAFRWTRGAEGWWEGIVGHRWVRVRSSPNSIEVQSAAPQGTRLDEPAPPANWDWLRQYLQVDVDLASVLKTFPDEPRMNAAVERCHGLRLLRQNPWECLGSFILSSTKQIVQIRQVVANVCTCFGDPIETPPGFESAWSFPSARRLASASEVDLRKCKMGFRATYLRDTAAMVAANEVNLAKLSQLTVESARAELLKLPGVGRKIADCVLLFAYGFPQAFPVDVWVVRALTQSYFGGKRASLDEIQKFASSHFGPNAGYAQQYLFHYIRTKAPGGAPPAALPG